MKLKIKIFLSMLCACCILVAAAGCGNSKTVQYNWQLAELGNDVSLHTQIQTEYLLKNYDKISSYAKGKEELSRPAPVHLKWEAQPLKETTAAVDKYVVEISRWHNFIESIKYETSENELDVYNLQLSAYYYWRVTARLTDGKKSISEASAFRTESAAPRNLYVDGITNVRDLGGWETADGGNVRQGMIYRCGRLNESETSTVNIEITEQGINTMRNELGVRTEIDLRMKDNPNQSDAAKKDETGGITSSPLGKDINYYHIPMDWVMSSNFNYLSDPKYNGAICKFFGYLANKKNYPIIFHCNIGTDRTGLFAFLINGLMGVSEEDLYRDYLFSNFGEIGGSRAISNIKSYVDTAKSYEGGSLSEKIENCLLDIGVSQADIDAVRVILAD